MFIDYRIVALACLVIVPPASAQSGQVSAPDTAHANLVAGMKQDLSRLLKAQDAYLERYRTYTAVLPRADFATRPERQVVITAHADKGYSATMTTTEEAGLACGLFVGVGQAPSPVVTGARQPACWRSAR